MRSAGWALALALVVAACGGSGTDHAAGGCADVVAAEVEPDGETFRLRVTVRSADTGIEKYADAWEVRSPSGEVLGVRTLTHPHVDEQPFTRSLGGVEIPAGLDEVEVAARDSVEGFCGATLTVPVPGR